ncbi:MAG: hypothetical protein ACLQVA_13200 [Candidatus Brocadiia bacterium]
MKRYGVAAVLSACLLWSWNCGASEPGQPSAQSSPPTARWAFSGTPASAVVVAVAAPASETAPFDPVLGAYQDSAVCRELYATPAAAHPFENLLPPSENNSIPADRSVSPGIGLPIGLGKNWTVRPWINFGLSTDGSESGDTVKSFSKARFGMSLSWAF